MRSILVLSLSRLSRSRRANALTDRKRDAQNDSPQSFASSRLRCERAVTTPFSGGTGAAWGPGAPGPRERGSGTGPAEDGTGAVPVAARRGARRAAESRAPVPVPSVHGWQHVSSLELAALPTAAACGRVHTKEVLWEWKLDQLADDAETLVSELLSNAIKASQSAQGAGLVALWLLADRERLVIEVWDQDPNDPRPRQVDHESEHGRGFMVIEALSNRWGYRRVSASLKVVWCELVIADY